MRKIMALAIVCFLAGAARSWAALGMGDLKFDGSLEVTGVSANNEADTKDATQDHRGDTATRLRLGMNANLTEGVMGRVEITRTPQSAGSNAYYGGNQSNQGENLNTYQSDLIINNAYINLDNLLGFQVRLGRQYVGDSGDLAWYIGPKSDDAMTVNSISGLDVKRTFAEKFTLDLFTGKTVDSNPGVATSTGDANLSNIGLAITNILPGGTINLAWQRGDNDNNKNVNPVIGDQKQRLQVYRVGLKGGLMENMITYRGEYLADGGDQAFADSKVKYKGSAVDLGAGVNLKELPLGKLSFAVNYAQASGDDKADGNDKAFHDLGFVGGYNVSDRYFGEIYGKDNAFNSNLTSGGNGLNQSGQGAGLKVLNFGAKYVPPVLESKLSAMVDYYVLNTDKKVNNSDKIGNELDLGLAYAHSANVNIEAGYAMLSSIGDTIRTTNHDSVTKLYSRLAVKWGGEEK